MARKFSDIDELTPLERLLLYEDHRLVKEGRIEEAMRRVRRRYRWTNRIILVSAAIVIISVLVQFLLGSVSFVQIALLALALAGIAATVRRRRQVRKVLEEARRTSEARRRSN